MKRLYDWFTNKYDEYDDEKGEWKEKRVLCISSPPAERGNGIRIIVRFNDGDEKMSYILDLFEGSDYTPDDDIFEVITTAIDGIMEQMP